MHSLPGFLLRGVRLLLAAISLRQYQIEATFCTRGIQCNHENGSQQARVPDQARATLGDRSRILPRVSPPARTLNQLDTRMLGALGGLSGLHILDDPNRA